MGSVQPIELIFHLILCDLISQTARYTDMAQEGKEGDDGTTTKGGAGSGLIPVGKYAFEIEISAENTGKTGYLHIIATEATHKDIFKLKLDAKSLSTMNWPNNGLQSIKQFVSSVLFDPDHGMGYEISFVKNAKSENKNDEIKQYIEENDVNVKSSGISNNDDNNMNSKKNSLEYNENDIMVIKIKFENKWFSQSWILNLEYQAQDEVGRLHLIINDLRNKLEEREQFELNFKGMIVMWSGRVNEIPNGWHLCDGTNGTPNLTNRFIQSCDPNGNNIGQTGGSKAHRHKIDVKGHQLTIAEMPSHNHGFQCGDYCDGASKYQTVANTGTRKYTEYTGGNQAHKHQADSNYTYHLPPYFILAFLIKL